jgi:hypothetical protein
MRALAIIAGAAAIGCAHHASADEIIQLAQATPNVVPPAQGLSTPITSTVTNCMMNCKRAGGELPNHVLHTAAADRDTLWVHNLQRDGEPDLHGSLRFDAACMSDELRPAVSFAVNK